MEALKEDEAMQKFETDYKETLAEKANVTPDRVKILVYAGSVKVASTILMESAEETDRLSNELLTTSPAEFLQSDALEEYGQPVVEVDTVQVQTYASPPPPGGVGGRKMMPPNQPAILAESTVSLGVQVATPLAFTLAVAVAAVNFLFW